MVKKDGPYADGMRGVVLAVALFALTGLSGCLEGEQDPSTVSTGGSASTSTSGSASTSPTNASAPAAANVTGDDEEGNRTATNQAPVVGSYGYNATGLTVVVSFNASDPDGDALSYTISFGDGSTNVTGTNSTGNATHAYAAAGAYNVTLVVSDGDLTVNRTLQVNVTTPASLGPIDKRSCSGYLGTNPAGLSINGAVSIGGCQFGSISAPMTVHALAGTGGCKHDASPTGSSTGYGTPVTKGATFPKGAAFRLICDVGVATFSGTLEFVPAA